MSLKYEPTSEPRVPQLAGVSEFGFPGFRFQDSAFRVPGVGLDLSGEGGGVDWHVIASSSDSCSDS